MLGIAASLVLASACLGNIKFAHIIICRRIEKVSRRKSIRVQVDNLRAVVGNILPFLLLRSDHRKPVQRIHELRVCCQRLLVFFVGLIKLTVLLMDISQQRPSRGKLRILLRLPYLVPSWLRRICLPKAPYGLSQMPVSHLWGSHARETDGAAFAIAHALQDDCAEFGLKRVSRGPQHYG